MAVNSNETSLTRIIIATRHGLSRTAFAHISYHIVIVLERVKRVRKLFGQCVVHDDRENKQKESPSSISLLIIRASYLRFVDLHAIKSHCFGYRFLLDFFIRRAENSFVRERGDQGTADRTEPVDPMMRPLIVPQCRCERSCRVHAATGIRAERDSEYGHCETEFDRHGIRVLLVSDIPDRAYD